MSPTWKCNCGATTERDPHRDLGKFAHILGDWFVCSACATEDEHRKAARKERERRAAPERKRQHAPQSTGVLLMLARSW